MVIETFDLTPTWKSMLPALLILLEDGDKEGKEKAKQELMRMAQAADQFREVSIVEVDKDDDEQDKIQKVANVAEAIFFEAVALNYPEVTTGDFPPDASFEFGAACEKAIDTWLLFNHPDRQP